MTWTPSTPSPWCGNSSMSVLVPEEDWYDYVTCQADLGEELGETICGDAVAGTPEEQAVTAEVAE